jgi:hypothetical protein
MRAIAIPGAALLYAIAMVSPASAADTPGAQVAKPEKIVCRREETVGTLFSTSVCLTRSQWKAREQASRDNKDHVMDEVNRQAIERPQPSAPTSPGG